jgi:hypothetical protein
MSMSFRATPSQSTEEASGDLFWSRMSNPPFHGDFRLLREHRLLGASIRELIVDPLWSFAARQILGAVGRGLALVGLYPEDSCAGVRTECRHTNSISPRSPHQICWNLARVQTTQAKAYAIISGLYICRFSLLLNVYLFCCHQAHAFRSNCLPQRTPAQ